MYGWYARAGFLKDSFLGLTSVSSDTIYSIQQLLLRLHIVRSFCETFTVVFSSRKKLTQLVAIALKPFTILPVSSKFGYPQIWVSRVPIFTKKWVLPYPYFQKYKYPRTYIYGKYGYPCGNMGIPFLLNWLLRSGASGLKWQSRGGMGKA